MTINAENYRNFPAVSNSDLSKLLSLFISNNRAIDLTYAYAMGTLIDVMITEPERVNYFRYTVSGEAYRYSKVDFEIAMRMRDSFYKDEFCRTLVSHCNFQHISYNPEFKLEWDGIKFTIPAKCKWDLISRIVDFGGDIKSTTATTEQQCRAAMSYFDYDRSRAWYMDLEGRNNDMLIFISKVNYKIFKIPITRDSEIYKSGKMKYLELAHKWHYLFGQSNQNIF